MPSYTTGLLKSYYSYSFLNSDAALWFTSAQIDLSKKLSEFPIERKVKNLIMFSADGMSLFTGTASRIFKGQRENLPFGEERELHVESFPYSGTSKLCRSSAG
jgi:alkaline phosphatase